MIYRRWSLLTGPTSIIGGIVGATIVANYLFIENDWLVKRDETKRSTQVLLHHQQQNNKESSKYDGLLDDDD